MTPMPTSLPKPRLKPGPKPSPESASRRLEANRILLAKRYAQMRAAGLCPFCQTPVKGRALCPDCQAKSNERIRERRHALKLQGLCVTCAKAPAGETFYCEPCRAGHRARKAELRREPEPRPLDPKAILAMPAVQAHLRALERAA